MDVKKIQETTISNLESIIEGVGNIEFVEEVSYSFNTKGLSIN